MLREISLFVSACLVIPSNGLAGDWPQWAGPDRNFIIRNVELADRWPADGPPRLWSRELGVGYSASG